MGVFIANISWLITSASIAGAVLNARGNIWGFYVWIVANTGWVIYNIQIDEYALAVLFFVYTCISSWGIYQWRKHGVKRKK